MAGLNGGEDVKSRKDWDTGEDRDVMRDVERRKARERRKAGERSVTLSKRMRMLADMVTAGNCVADVGCDHAFLSIYLVQTGKCPKCLAMDVRKGPLSGAKEHIASHGLGEYIETRLSDGLSAYHTGEAQTLVCAGMGGKLMEKILTEGGEKARSFKELILQPQSEIPEFRIYLRKAGFLISEEEAVYEDGKFYFAMKAVYKEQDGVPERDQLADQERFVEKKRSISPEMSAELYDLYGKQLLLSRHPVLMQYLQKRLQAVEELTAQLQQKDSIKGKERQRELSLEKEQLKKALEIYEKGR